MSEELRSNEIDVAVGRRLAILRRQAQEHPAVLAQSIGLSEAEYARCEAGENRLGASQLFVLAKLLKVELSDFFSEINVR